MGATQKQVIAIAVRMLGTDPTLSGAVTTDELATALADGQACADLARYLDGVMTQVSNTGRLRIEVASRATNEIVAVARKRAPHSATLARDVAQVDALRATGPTVDKAERSALVKQQKATRATARATRATQKATAATARASGLQHGKGDATITQPAPAAPAPSTTAPAPVPTIR